MTTFALVHGGFHTSKCWYLLTDELQRRGHRTLTVDLPVSDPTADADRYLEAAVEAFKGADEPVIIVGHSIAGWTAMRLVDRIPAAGIIFLCSCINLEPGVHPDEPTPMIVADPKDWTPDERGVITMDPEVGRESFYHDVPDDVATLALSWLVPQAVAGIAGPSGRISRPHVPSVYVQAADDRAVAKPWSDFASTLLTGRPPIVIAGSHSPFLSRPSDLADLFDRLADDFVARSPA